jgi:hypothetical protein
MKRPDDDRDVSLSDNGSKTFNLALFFDLFLSKVGF